MLFPAKLIHSALRFVAAAVLALPAAAALSAADTGSDGALPGATGGDRDAARIEAYLNDIATLRAGFIQVAPDGSITEGTMYLDRPGRIRFEYSPPSQILIVARDKWITLIDYEIRQVSRWPVADTPLRVFVEKDVRFGDTIDIASVERSPGLVAVTVHNAKDPREGSIKLIFTEMPLELRQWEITDPRGLTTKVGLVNMETNIEIDPGVFAFDDPRPRSRRRRGQ